jgi:hypothetical protein
MASPSCAAIASAYRVSATAGRMPLNPNGIINATIAAMKTLFLIRTLLGYGKEANIVTFLGLF